MSVVNDLLFIIAYAGSDAGKAALGRHVKEVERLRAVAEQAVEHYAMLRERAADEGDAQEENFWEGHEATALHALGKLDEANAVVDRVLGPIPDASGTTPMAGEGERDG